MTQLLSYVLASLLLGFALFTQLLIFSFPSSEYRNDAILKPIAERMEQITSKTNQYPQLFDLFHFFGIMFLFGEICLAVFLILKFLMSLILPALAIGIKLLIYLFAFGLVIAVLMFFFEMLPFPNDLFTTQFVEQAVRNFTPSVPKESVDSTCVNDVCSKNSL